MITTKIQWCDSTRNHVRGCEGCELWNHLQMARNIHYVPEYRTESCEALGAKRYV